MLAVERSSVGPVEDAAVEGPADVGIEVGVPMEEPGDSMIEEENVSCCVYYTPKDHGTSFYSQDKRA